ncbi:MAG: IgA Peptidase M64 [Alistipes sp.]|jgi:hypothetical protein|nr:IgA Peptidase M64 [Alistipes sp.]
MRRLILLLTLLPFAAQAQTNAQFEKWFEPATLRFDYHHAGDATTEEYFFDELRREPHWAGSRTTLIDDTGFGSQMFRIVDAATGQTIYSRTYCTLWNEWQFTAEAKQLRKSMPESVVFPLPKNEVRIEFHTRDRNGAWVKKYEQSIDPRSYFIAQYPLRHETFDVEINGAPEHTVDIVLLPEGYTAAERKKFEQAAKNFARDIFSYEPYRELRKKFNIRAVWTPSQDSGVTMPGAGEWRNTSAKASFWTFDSERYQMTEDFQNLRDQAAHVPYELIYVLSNSDKYGGGGIYNFYALSSAGDYTSRAGVYIHEFGHLLLGLGDEYIGGVSYDEQSMYPAHREPWEVNLTTLVDFESKAWSRMLPEGTPIPTPLTRPAPIHITDPKATAPPPMESVRADELGVYEGGGYVTKGVYRPWPNCLMNNLHTIGEFCPVCEAGIRNHIEFLCR